MNDTLSNHQEPTDLLLQRAVPIIENRLGVIQQQIAAEFRQIAAQIEHQNRMIQPLTNLLPTIQPLTQLVSRSEALGRIIQHWEAIASGELSLNLSLNLGRQQEEGFGSLSLSGAFGTEESAAATATTTTTTANTTSAAATAANPAAATAITATTAPATATAIAALSGPVYPSMNRTNVNSLPSLWQEWFEGYGIEMSVVEMERRFGTRWRRDDRDKKWFQKRGKVIKCIETFAADHPELNINEVLELLESRRVADQERSIDWLAKHPDFLA